MCQGPALSDPPEQSGRPAKSGPAPSQRATPHIFEGDGKREKDGRLPAPKQTTGAREALATHRRTSRTTSTQRASAVGRQQWTSLHCQLSGGRAASHPPPASACERRGGSASAFA